jgi:hypothetical protein
VFPTKTGAIGGAKERTRESTRDPSRESKRERERERILCSIFFDRKKALAERETRRSFVVQDWKKRGKLRKFKFEHIIIKRIVTSSSL